MKLNYISSKSNSKLKSWRNLHKAKYRKKEGLYLIEGSHLIEEAYKAKKEFNSLIVTESYYEEGELTPLVNELASIGVDTYVIKDYLADSISFTKASQGIFAVLEVESYSEEIPIGRRYLLLDGVQDPGNLGTLIRTASAASYTAVILGEGCSDPYNDKVIRSAQGSIWQVSIIEMPLESAISKLQEQGVVVYASNLDASSKDYRLLDRNDKIALILGNEGQGVRDSYIKQADLSVHIPMPGEAESLNVGVAGGILMFYFVE